MFCCIWCRWQGFGSDKTAASGEVSVRRGQGFPHAVQPVPTDPPQGTVEPLSHAGGTSLKMYLGKGKNIHTGRQGEKKEKNSPVNTQVSEERAEGGAPGARAEISLKPMEMPWWSRYFPAVPGKDHAGADIHKAVLCGRPHARTD